MEIFNTVPFSIINAALIVGYLLYFKYIPKLVNSESGLFSLYAVLLGGFLIALAGSIFTLWAFFAGITPVRTPISSEEMTAFTFPAILGFIFIPYWLKEVFALVKSMLAPVVDSSEKDDSTE
jgi:hypothetical protein